MLMAFLKTGPRFKPGISGKLGSVCGASPSNFSVNVALSPSVIVSGLSDAVKLAARAVPPGFIAASDKKPAAKNKFNLAIIIFNG